MQILGATRHSLAPPPPTSNYVIMLPHYVAICAMAGNVEDFLAWAMYNKNRANVAVRFT